MSKLNNEKLAKIEAGKMSNRECMIAGSLAIAGAAFSWTGVGAATMLMGVGSALNGGCFR